MKKKKNKSSLHCPVSRRTFLKSSAVATAALTVDPARLFAEPSKSSGQKSIVSITENLKSITDSFKVDPKRVREMVDEGIKNLTNTPTSKEAWLKIFPNLKEKEVIGLKVNTVNPKIPAHPEVGHAIVDSMVDAGINLRNILIWDNLEQFLTAAGYTINTSDKGYRCYGTYHDETMGLDPDVKVNIPSVGIDRSYSKILTQQIDYLINVPVLKVSHFAGITMALKNMYGTISLSEQSMIGIFPPDMGDVVVKMHAHNCNPQIAEVNAGETLMKKTKLVIADALMGIYEGSAHVGPQGVDHKIIMSQDRVAADYTGLQILNKRRKERGIELITNEKAGILKSAEKLGVGTADPEKIEVRKVQLTT